MSRITRLSLGFGGALVIALASVGARAVSFGGSGDAAPNAAAPTAEQAPPADPDTLRICAAKNQPPLSMEDGSGLENKIGVTPGRLMSSTTTSGAAAA
jgi:mxaJ protein